MSFDPTEHLVKTKGNQLYLEAKWRLVWLREEHPDAVVETEIVTHDLDNGAAVVRAVVTLPSGARGTGHKLVTGRSFSGGYLEKAETQAVARALAMLGFGTQHALELDEDERTAEQPADSPVTPPPTRTVTTPAGGVTIAPRGDTDPWNIQQDVRADVAARVAAGQVVLERQKDGLVALNGAPLGTTGTDLFEALRKATNLGDLGAAWIAVNEHKSALGSPALEALTLYKEQRKAEMTPAAAAGPS